MEEVVVVPVCEVTLVVWDADTEVVSELELVDWLAV